MSSEVECALNCDRCLAFAVQLGWRKYCKCQAPSRSVVISLDITPLDWNCTNFGCHCVRLLFCLLMPTGALRIIAPEASSLCCR